MKKTSVCLILAILLIFTSFPASAYKNPIILSNNDGIPLAAGDPFVMKYNGTYYCYVSGGNCWRSANMTDWEFLGCVFQGEHTQNLFAPEVFYWNGAFYSISSPNGTTNYIFKSDRPEGPFLAISDAIGGEIDGSLFRDDDGSIWFMHAGWSGIKLLKTDSPEVPATPVATLPQSISGMWTEGPSMFKRDGMYYMTFTGNHVQDRAYRVEYAMSENVSEGWYEPPQNILLLSTEGETSALGHNSVVIGPDLDSYYIVYHNRYPDGTSYIDRSYNMQRILWNEEKPTVVCCTKAQEDPELPTFEDRPAGGIRTLSATMLFESRTEEIYTAEFNLIPGNTEILFAYRDDKNYCRLAFSPEQLHYTKVTGGVSESQTVPLADNTSLDVLQCVRIQQTAEELSIYLEGGLLLKTAAVGGGQIGYEAENGTVGYTAFSNKALGNRDHTAQKFTGATYDAVFANNCEELTLVDAAEAGKALRMTPGEQARFALTVPAQEKVTVSLRGCAPEPVVFNLYVNDMLVKEKVTFAAGQAYRTEILRGIVLPEGTAQIAVEITEGTFDFYQLGTTAEDDVSEMKLLLDRRTSKISPQEGNAKYADGELLLISTAVPEGSAESFAKAVTGSAGWGDYSVEVKLRLQERSPDAQMGIFLRAANVSNTEASGFRFKRAWYQQGYYACITQHGLRLYKHNYTETLLARKPLQIDMLQEHTLKVSAVGDVITVWLNGEEMIRYADLDHPFTNGKAGLQVVNGNAAFTELVISPLGASAQYDPDQGFLLWGEKLLAAALICAGVLLSGGLTAGILLSKRKKRK